MAMNEGFNLMAMAVASALTLSVKTRSNWAVVETVDPLTIILEEDISETPREPSENAVGELKVGQRVRVAHEDKRLIITEAPDKVDNLAVSDLGGWGSYLPPGSDFNTYKTPGHWYNAVSAEVAGMTNAPPNNQAGALLVLRASGVIQYWHEYNINVTDGNVWRRRWYEATDSWSDWQLYQGPALFEVGSNGNGSWIRFPSSGFQLCWVTFNSTSIAINTAYGSMYISTALTWTYPRAFTSEPAVACSRFHWAGSASWGSVISAGTSAATYRGANATSLNSGTSVGIALTAIGVASS